MQPKQATKPSTIWENANWRNTTRSMELYYCWLYPRTAAVERPDNQNHVHRHNSHSMQTHKIYDTETSIEGNNSAKTSITNTIKSLYLDWTTKIYHIRSRQAIHVKILGNNYGSMRNWTKIIYCQLPADRQLIRKNDPIYWTIPTTLPGLESG